MFIEKEGFSLQNYDNCHYIWRYMDFTKFVSLLSESALFFCTGSQMRVLDPYEGYYPEIDLERLTSEKQRYDNPLQLAKKSTKYRQIFLKNVSINCWHVSNCESAAMWKMYLKSDEGLVIKTTLENLKEAFQNNQEDNIYIGKIAYRDYDNDGIKADYQEYIQTVSEYTTKRPSDKSIFNKFEKYFYPLLLTKRNHFDYEKEIRAISPIKFNSNKQSNMNSGKFVKVDLNVLIREIIIAPTAPKWLEALVKDVCNKYNLDNIKVYQSKLYDEV